MPGFRALNVYVMPNIVAGGGIESNLPALGHEVLLRQGHIPFAFDRDFHVAPSVNRLRAFWMTRLL
jgi:hypothetical protein